MMKNVDNIMEKYQEILAAHCKNNTFTEEGIDEWFKEIFPYEAEHAYKYFKKNYEWIKPPDTIIITIGFRVYGPAIFLYTALKYLAERRSSVNSTKNTRVYLVCTTDTKSYAEKIVENLQPAFTELAPHFDYIEVSRSNIEDIYSKLKGKLFHNGVLHRGIYYVDLTGGTKAMSSSLLGLAYTASLLGTANSIFYLFYVEAESKTPCKNAPAPPLTSKIRLQGDPLEIFKDYVIKSILSYNKAFMFDKAEEITQKLTIQPPLSPQFKDSVKALTRIVNFTKSLAMLNFRASLKALEELSKDLPSGETYTLLSREGIHINDKIIGEAIREINPLKEFIGQNPLSVLEEKKCKSQLVEDCTYTKEFSNALLILAEILYLVGRAWEKKFPALSVQLYYRALEMSLQAYLLRKGIWAGGNTPISKLERLGLSKDVLDSLKVKAEVKNGGELVVKLALYDDARIINDLEGDFPEFENLRNYTEPRNTSIIAHGLQPPSPGKGNFDKLRRYTSKIIEYISEKIHAPRASAVINLVQEVLGIQG